MEIQNAKCKISPKTQEQIRSVAMATKMATVFGTGKLVFLWLPVYRRSQTQRLSSEVPLMLHLSSFPRYVCLSPLSILASLAEKYQIRLNYAKSFLKMTQNSAKNAPKCKKIAKCKKNPKFKNNSKHYSDKPSHGFVTGLFHALEMTGPVHTRMPSLDSFTDQFDDLCKCTGKYTVCAVHYKGMRLVYNYSTTRNWSMVVKHAMMAWIFPLGILILFLDQDVKVKKCVKPSGLVENDCPNHHRANLWPS